MKYYLFLILLIVPTVLFGQGISGTWSTVSSTGFTPRYGLTSSVIGSKIYVMGGHITTGGACNILEVYDPSTDTWSTPITIGTFTARYGLTSSVVDGKIFVIGGIDNAQNQPDLNTLEVFDPLSNTWSTPTTTGNFTKREWLTSSVVGNKIYVFGGLALAGKKALVLNTLEVFDPSSNTWSTPTTSGTFTPRWGLCSAVVSGKIYLYGGYNKDSFGGATNTVELFDPVTNQFTTPLMKGPFLARDGSSSSVLNGIIYIIGGEDKGGNAIDSLNIFDPSSNTWSTPITNGDLTPRQWHTSSVVNEKIYSIGGINNHSPFINPVQVFTPAQNSVLEKRTKSFDIFLSPNPTNGILKIQNAPTNLQEIKVVNILGETVMEMKNLYSADITLDLSKLVRGAYYIRFISANSVTTKMVVLQN